MSEDWLSFWNARYIQPEYAYGELPNNYLKEKLEKTLGKKILFAAEGEGRNAVYAAKQGWDVSAYDLSVEGKNKAEKLAKKNAVHIDYRIGELEKLNFTKHEFDVIVLIYAHFPAAIKSQQHQLLDTYLKKGGTIIFEGFSKNNLKYRLENEQIGGPKDIASLFSIEEIQADFKDYEIIELEEKVVELNEGACHNGTGSVIRFIGRKK